MKKNIRYLCIISSILITSVSLTHSAAEVDNEKTRWNWDQLCMAIEYGIADNTRHYIPKDHRDLEHILGVKGIVPKHIKPDQRRKAPGLRQNGQPICRSNGSTPYDIALFNLQHSIKNQEKRGDRIPNQLLILDYLTLEQYDATYDIWSSVTSALEHGNLAAIQHYTPRLRGKQLEGDSLETIVQNHVTDFFKQPEKSIDEVLCHKLLAISEYILTNRAQPVPQPSGDEKENDEKEMEASKAEIAQAAPPLGLDLAPVNQANLHFPPGGLAW